MARDAFVTPVRVLHQGGRMLAHGSLGIMNASHLVAALLGLSLLAGCSFEGIRMGERRRCVAMPQSASERCLQRTAMTKAEYDARRVELKRSLEGKDRARREAAPESRYEQWVP